MSGDHNKIIAAAAKAGLASLGFLRSGRSRLWLADRGPWLNVVEFTPSRWLKGVSLTNAAHWLWVGAGFMSFNEAIASKCHAEFETEGQFVSAVGDIVETAREAALKLEDRFGCFSATAAFAIERARSSPERMAPSWWGYEAGIAAALMGNVKEARNFLDGITDKRVVERAASLLPLLDDLEAFRAKVNDNVAHERARLKLKALSHPAF